ncbi:MAG: CinA family nicotinamide mononucleotide deamidase-related protein [Candidatus Neomarinimicrobiota bacterium]
MRVAVLTIGNELLSGKTVNTNASWISNVLSSEGASINRHLTIPDEKEAIIDCLDLLFKSKIDLIVCTGGLGPTDDDITRGVVFDYFGSEEVFDDTYWNYLSDKFLNAGYQLFESSKSQAIIPNNGDIIPNDSGSARGLVYKKNNTTLMVLPGVPIEMKGMVTHSIIPWVKNKIVSKIYSFNFRTTGVPESVLFEKVKKIDFNSEDINVGYYPSLYGVDVRISHTDKKSLDGFKILVAKSINKYIYTVGNESIEDVLVNKFLNQSFTISTAESCTGGLIGNRLTNVPGSSEIYYGGLITYSNQSKINDLDISAKSIDDFGAVSKEVALEMAKNIKTKFKTDIGVSVTGIAGPGGGTDLKPVGLVYVGYCDKNILKVKKFNFTSNRESNKIRTSQAVFNFILSMI